jgi:hypothetical protein
MEKHRKRPKAPALQCARVLEKLECYAADYTADESSAHAICRTVAMLDCGGGRIIAVSPGARFGPTRHQEM